MSYCINPTCKKPQNPDKNKFCQNCGSSLVLREHYRIVKPLGTGAFSRTFLAVDEDIPSKTTCAIKQFFPVATPGSGTNRNLEKASEQFRREALQLDRLGKHPQIPRLLAYFEIPPHRYLVQEFIQGKNLAEELAEDGTFDETKIRNLLKDLLPVLQFVHSNQIIHRDLKPENIIRRGSSSQWGGNLCLVGFGSAKVLSTTPTITGDTAIGSPEYTAPEQLVGHAVFASDIYSLAAICIELMTQTNIFKLRHGEEWKWEEFLPRPVSASLSRVLNKMLETPLKSRYQWAEEVLRDLMQTDGGSWEEVETLTGHADKVRTVAFAADGQTLVSGGEDNSIKVWSLATENPPKTLGGWVFGHSGWVQAIAISPDGQTLASGSVDGMVKVWNLGTGKLVRSLGSWFGGDRDAVQAIAISKDGQILASGHNDKTIKVWYLNSGKLRGILKGHSAWVESVAISPDGEILASGSGDKTIKLWQLTTGKLLSTLDGHGDIVRSVAISPDGQVLASGSGDKTVKLWRLATGEFLGSSDGGDRVNAVAISPDGQTLAAGTRDGRVCLWNLFTLEELAVLDCEATVNGLAFSGDGEILAAGCSDGTIGVWGVAGMGGMV
jgi:WD40 repeat protein